MAVDLISLLGRLEAINTSESVAEALRDKLCILAVAEGRKLAAMVYLDDLPGPIAQRLSTVAGDFGLIARTVVLNADPWARTPHVPRSCLAAIEKLWHMKSGRPTLWIARQAVDIPRRIRRAPDRTTGAYLGYPQCCDAAYLEGFVSRAERLYELVRQRWPDKSDHALVETIRTDPALERGEAQRVFGGFADVNDTVRKFPFVPHVACSDCLTEKSRATRAHDEYYRDLADRVGLTERILRSTRAMSEQ